VSPVAVLVILLLLGLSFYLTLTRSVAMVFTYLMLPAVLLLFTVRSIEVQKLPDVTTLGAISYGILFGLAARGIRKTFVLGTVDYLLLLLLAWRIVASVATGNAWTGVSTLGSDMLMVVVPYFAARAAFVDREWRLKAAKVIAYICVFLAVVALIEMRLKPLFFSRNVLAPFGLNTVDYAMVLKRFGLFRAQATFCHPIDLGNGAALLGCMLLVLATTSGQRLYQRWVLAGFVSCIIMAGASMSYTSYLAGIAITIIFLLLRFAKIGAYLLVPIGLTALTFFSLATHHFVVNEPVAPEFAAVAEDDKVGSLYIRHLIVHRTWPMTSTAGWFGWGENNFRWTRDFELESIDNAYVLFVLSFGWGYVVLFLLVAFTIAIASMRALLRVESGQAREPLAAGVAGVIGTFIGMYTVFFGFVYATLLWMLLALVSSMIREVFERTGEKPPIQLEAGRQSELERAQRQGQPFPVNG
jgi:hypothetical protein